VSHAIRPNGRRVKDDYREVVHRLRTPRVEVQRGASWNIVWGSIAGTNGTRSCSGKNRLIYLWGHLAAVNDRLLPLLGIGERLHPELDGMFISNPDKSVPLTVSEQSLKTAWQEINQKLWDGFSEFSDSDWAQWHTAVSEEDSRAGNVSKSIRGAARKKRAPCLSLGASGIGAAKAILRRFASTFARDSHSYALVAGGWGSKLMFSLVKPRSPAFARQSNSFSSKAGLESRRRSVLKAIWPSIRAKGAPKQK